MEKKKKKKALEASEKEVVLQAAKAGKELKNELCAGVALMGQHALLLPFPLWKAKEEDLHQLMAALEGGSGRPPAKLSNLPLAKSVVLAVSGLMEK